MIIRVFGHSGETRFPFEKAGPWVYFKSRLEELGHEIAEEGKSPADAIIANFHSPRVLRYAKANKIPQHRRTLILWEPWIVEKTRYEDKVLKQYGKVLCPSIIWAQRVNGEAFFWPQDRMKPIEDFYSWKKRKNKLI